MGIFEFFVFSLALEKFGVLRVRCNSLPVGFPWDLPPKLAANSSTELCMEMVENS